MEVEDNEDTLPSRWSMMFGKDRNTYNTNKNADQEGISRLSMSYSGNEEKKYEVCESKGEILADDEDEDKSLRREEGEDILEWIERVKRESQTLASDAILTIETQQSSISRFHNPVAPSPIFSPQTLLNHEVLIGNKPITNKRMYENEVDDEQGCEEDLEEARKLLSTWLNVEGQVEKMKTKAIKQIGLAKSTVKMDKLEVRSNKRITTPISDPALAMELRHKAERLTHNNVEERRKRREEEKLRDDVDENRSPVHANAIYQKPRWKEHDNEHYSEPMKTKEWGEVKELSDDLAILKLELQTEKKKLKGLSHDKDTTEIMKAKRQLKTELEKVKVEVALKEEERRKRIHRAVRQFISNKECLIMKKSLSGWRHVVDGVVDIRKVALQKAKRRSMRKNFIVWRKSITDFKAVTMKCGILFKWKCRVKIWNLWLEYTDNKKMERQMATMQIELREEKSKESKANTYCRRTLLSKMFLQWYSFGMNNKAERLEMLRHQERKEKMKLLIENIKVTQEKKVEDDAPPSPPPPYSSPEKHERLPVLKEATRKKVLEPVAQPAVLVAMEKRDSLRKARREALEFKYEQKREQIRLLEEEKRGEELRRIEEQSRLKKELKMKEKEEAMIKEMEALKLKADFADKVAQAVKLRKQCIYRFRGWIPWRQFVDQGHLLIRKATHHWKYTLLSNVFNGWREVLDQLYRRDAVLRDRAVFAYKKNLTTKGFLSFVHSWSESEKKQHEIQIRNRLLTMKRGWQCWWGQYSIIANNRKAIEAGRYKIATRHNDRKMLSKCVDSWKRYKMIYKKEQLEIREKEQLWTKVNSWLSEGK